ncbi:hypothetical protein [Streptomyces sp. NPDC047014]|uniref:hypothetical protein n=1 Tax=Streptomyces sp. NPDC047014 TaxID=3155736 RepID=UPI0033EBB3DE
MSAQQSKRKVMVCPLSPDHDHQPVPRYCRGVPCLRRPRPTTAHADEYTLTEAITSLPIAEEIREGYKRELYVAGGIAAHSQRISKNDTNA